MPRIPHRQVPTEETRKTLGRLKVLQNDLAPSRSLKAPQNPCVKDSLKALEFFFLNFIFLISFSFERKFHILFCTFANFLEKTKVTYHKHQISISLNDVLKNQKSHTMNTKLLSHSVDLKTL